MTDRTYWVEAEGPNWGGGGHAAAVTGRTYSWAAGVITGLSVVPPVSFCWSFVVDCEEALRTEDKSGAGGGTADSSLSAAVNWSARGDPSPANDAYDELSGWEPT